jgi:hypothetical protein
MNPPPSTPVSPLPPPTKTPFVPSPFCIPHPPPLEDDFSLTPPALEDRFSAAFQTQHPFYRIPPPDERVWSYVETTQTSAPLQKRFLVHREYIRQGTKWIIHDAITVRTEANSLGGWMRKLAAYESTERSPFPYDINALDQSSNFMEQQEVQRIATLWTSLQPMEEDPYLVMKRTLLDSGAFDPTYTASPKEAFTQSKRRVVQRSQIQSQIKNKSNTTS